jgi:hypothetical protein
MGDAGQPLTHEIGPRDMQAEKLVLARRDSGEKKIIPGLKRSARSRQALRISRSRLRKSPKPSGWNIPRMWQTCPVFWNTSAPREWAPPTPTALRAGPLVRLRRLRSGSQGQNKAPCAAALGDKEGIGAAARSAEAPAKHRRFSQDY